MYIKSHEDKYTNQQFAAPFKAADFPQDKTFCI
jgi:hypothetical protein